MRAVRRVAARPSSPTSRRFDADVDRLTTAIKRGGNLNPLLKALRESDARRAELR